MKAAELRAIPDDKLREELSFINIAIDRGMSRKGTKDALKTSAAMEGEIARRKGLKPIQWLMTNPTGKSHTHPADDGRTGWKWHAVEATGEMTFRELGHSKALCGLRPRNGWGYDLFAEQANRCSRCVKKSQERGSK